MLLWHFQKVPGQAGVNVATLLGSPHKVPGKLRFIGRSVL